MDKISVIILFVFFANSILSQEKQAWEMVWNEEFNYSGLPDTSIWSYDECRGCGNKELQFYTVRDERNARVEKGHLILEAHKKDTLSHKYTSARIKTKHIGDWTYGRIEVKADIPSGKGIWPAIWMLPTDWEYGQWPQSGEIDIMEYVGFNPGTIYGTVHTGAFNHSIGTQVGDSVFHKSVEADYHIYAIEWDSNSIKFFFDQKYYFTFKNEHKSYKEWPFDKAFHLILNIAVGGNWAGKYGIDDSIFPQQMKIDYVRVYQKK